jgi:hypothetical protein
MVQILNLHQFLPQAGAVQVADQIHLLISQTVDPEDRAAVARLLLQINPVELVTLHSEAPHRVIQVD